MTSTPTLVKELQVVVGDAYVLHDHADLIVFEYDGSVDKALPSAVVLPASAEEVSEVVKIARRHDLPIVARGAGTGLSGGAVAERGGLLMPLTRMTRILEIDVENRIAVVEPGLVNIELTDAVSKYGLYYAPDPSSQKACTIGGNVAENSGGPHCLAYGVTTNHVLGLEIVLADGSVQWIGGKSRDGHGYDLRGVMVGSEGTLGIVTKAVVRLLTRPEAVKTLLAVFRDLDDASAAVSGIIAAGIVPAAIEMMDDICIEAVEPAVRGATRLARAPYCWSRRTASWSRSRRRSRRSSGYAGCTTLSKSAPQPTTRSANGCGPDARESSAPSAGWRPTTTWQTALSREPGWWRCWLGSKRYRGRAASLSQICFTRATGTFIRPCCSMSADRVTPSGSWR